MSWICFLIKKKQLKDSFYQKRLKCNWNNVCRGESKKIVVADFRRYTEKIIQHVKIRNPNNFVASARFRWSWWSEAYIVCGFSHHHFLQCRCFWTVFSPILGILQSCKQNYLLFHRRLRTGDRLPPFYWHVRKRTSSHFLFSETKSRM